MKRFFVLLFFVAFFIPVSCFQTSQTSENQPSDHTGDESNLPFYKQTNVDLENISEGKIKALVDDEWIVLDIAILPDDFMTWNIARRREALEMWKNGEMPPLSGPHSGMVATYGAKREDTRVSINNAVKGLGFLPKEEFIKEVTSLLLSNYDSSFIRKLEILDSLYQNPEIFDRTKQVSLELYTSEDFKTGSFLNIMKNPLVSIVFLDIPSFEVKAVAQLIYPEGSDLSERDRGIVEYVNTVHDFIHGVSPRKSFAIVFHVIEVFDNSPRSRGIRIVP
ncbi:hypothetical protein JXA84_03925 [candidate division WOR-3 bacterium]|nr:hypothetical protein [candidate division WOR-3 bacterium]